MSSPPPPSPRRGASLQLPSDLLPPKKRWARLSRTPTETAAPVPTPVPVLVPQIHAPTSAADALPSPTLAPEMDVAASSPAAAVQKYSSSPPHLAGDQELHAPPAAEVKPSAPPPSKRVRKVVRKVRKIVKRLVPKGTSSSAAATAGASQSQAAVDKDATDEEAKEKGSVQFAPEKLTSDHSNAAATPGSSLGEEITTAGEELAGATVVVAGEPAVEKPVSTTGEEKVEPVTTAVSGRLMRMREVFVGALDFNAKEEDVRAALAEAGEITEVRMVMNVETPTKNRGYCFVQYREAGQARKAIAELSGVKICGKECRIQPLGRNDKAKIPQRADIEGYTSIHYHGENWPALGDNFPHYISANRPAMNGINASYYNPPSSPGVLHHAMVGYSPSYHHGSSMYHPGSSYYGPAGQFGRIRGGKPVLGNQGIHTEADIKRRVH